MAPNWLQRFLWDHETYALYIKTRILSTTNQPGVRVSGQEAGEWQRRMAERCGEDGGDPSSSRAIT